MNMAKRNAHTRFLMIVQGQRVWMTFTDCYQTIDYGWLRGVVDGGLALDVVGTGKERPLTPQEKSDINNAADEYSGSK